MRTTHYAFHAMSWLDPFSLAILAFISTLILSILAVAHLADIKDRPETTIPKDTQ